MAKPLSIFGGCGNEFEYTANGRYIIISGFTESCGACESDIWLIKGKGATLIRFPHTLLFCDLHDPHK